MSYSWESLQQVVAKSSKVPILYGDHTRTLCITGYTRAPHTVCCLASFPHDIQSRLQRSDWVANTSNKAKTNPAIFKHFYLLFYKCVGNSSWSLVITFWDRLVVFSEYFFDKWAHSLPRAAYSLVTSNWKSHWTQLCIFESGTAVLRWPWPSPGECNWQRSLLSQKAQRTNVLLTLAPRSSPWPISQYFLFYQTGCFPSTLFCLRLTPMSSILNQPSKCLFGWPAKIPQRPAQELSWEAGLCLHSFLNAMILSHFVVQ